MNKTWSSVFVWSVLLTIFLITLFFGGLTLYALFTYHSYDFGRIYSINVTQNNPSFSLTIGSGIFIVILITIFFFILVLGFAQILRIRRNASKES